MDNEATINARMPRPLKEAGTSVLNRCGLSHTQLVRSVYRYLRKEQKIPPCLDIAQSSDSNIIDSKRSIAKSLAGTITLPVDFDVHTARRERHEGKYGELL